MFKCNDEGGKKMIVEILIAFSVISAWIITFCEAFEVWED